MDPFFILLAGIFVISWMYLAYETGAFLGTMWSKMLHPIRDASIKVYTCSIWRSASHTNPTVAMHVEDLFGEEEE